METIGIIGLFLGILAIIWFSVKGLNIIIGAPLATLIVILANRMDIFDSLLGDSPSYITGLAGFIINNFSIFLLGAVLAQYMEKSNSTVSIADYVLSKVGTKNKFAVLVALSLVAALLTYGGISLFVVMFALIPLARSIFKKLDVNWALVPIPLFLGIGTFATSMLPGAPSIQNAVPTTYLGTPLTAAPALGLAAAVSVIIFGLLYMKWALDRSLAKGETFYSYLDNQGDIPIGEIEEEELEENVPSVWLAIAPLLSLVLIILIFSHVQNIILVALTVAILLSAVLFRPYLVDQKALLNQGAAGSVPSVFATSSSVAFGTVLTNAPAFAVVQSGILSIPGNPLIGLAVASALLGGITGSSSGALGIIMGNFAQTYIDLGINPEVIHRVAVVASAIITIVPHSGAVITFNNVAGLKLRNSFWHTFNIVNISHLIAVIVMLILSSLIY